MIRERNFHIFGVSMTRRLCQFIILILILLSLAAAPAQRPSVDAAWIGVRIPADQREKLNHIDLGASKLIDYDAFLWVTLPEGDLAQLDAADLSYQSYSNPYSLTLGGGSFDPLHAFPLFDTTWEQPDPQSGARLSLVQFHGPTKEEWMEELQNNGLEIVQYIHPFTYLVWGDSTALDKSHRQESIRWAGDYLPSFAIQPQNQNLSSDEILVRAMIYPQAGLDQTLKAIQGLGGHLVNTAKDVDPAFDLASFTLAGDKLPSVAALNGVYSIQPVPTDGGDRGELGNQVNAGNLDGGNRAFPGYLDWLAELGLSGQDVIIANVDSGIDQDHPDLANRMLPCTGATCGDNLLSDHGTHTAGIMAGDGSSGITDGFGFLRGLGMAPGANLVEQVYSPTYQEEAGMLTLMTQSYRNGAVISGNSWGPSNTPLGYDLDTRLVDIGVRDADPDEPGNQPLTYVLSMMNGNGGTSTQGTPDEAKNILTVGSTDLQDSSGSQLSTINDLSSNTAHGPALDGRDIPHLVAPGCSVDSTTTNDSYGFICGTSMASPHVTGAVALFYEQYRQKYGMDPSPAMVKAAFLAVTHDLAGNQDADGHILGHPFDSKQGWGRLNADAVLNPSEQVIFFDQRTKFDYTGETWTYTLPSSDPIDYLHAMLTWTDAPGHGRGGSEPAWVNDLDLSITCNGLTYYGNNFGADGYSLPGYKTDVMNNTEGIFLPPTQDGPCTLTVIAANISGDGIPNFGNSTDQDFALAVYYSHSEPEPNPDPDPEPDPDPFTHIIIFPFIFN